MVKFFWTPIVRHQLVAGGASPDDADLADYWAKRRRRVKPPLDEYNLRLLAKQLTLRLDSLNSALPGCEKSAGSDPATVTTTLTSRLKAYDDALLAFRAGVTKPDSTKTVSQQ